MRVCLVEDNDLLRETLTHVLTEAGFVITAVPDADALDEVLKETAFDTYLLDLNLPGEDGLSIAKRLKRAYPDCFIVMTTARERVADRALGYDTGADIYMTKPVHLPELVAALNGLYRRWQAQSQASDDLDWVLQTADRVLMQGASGRMERLTPTELVIVKALVEAPDQRLAYWQLLDRLDKVVDEGAKRALEVHVVNLRRKLRSLGASDYAIAAVRGSGYRLALPIVVRD